jgi:hypothetical protein
MKIRTIIAVALLALLPMGLAAQSAEAYATLDYYDDFSLVIQLPAAADGTIPTLSDAGGDLYFGIEIPVGSTIVTTDGTAELTLVPNGSVMKLAAGTRFTIEDLSASRNSGNNNFSVAAGRVRTVAARLGGNAQMRIRSSSAIAGVRGTDFTFDADLGELWVQEGLVDFGAAGEGFDFLGDAIQLAQGQFAGLDFTLQSFDPAQFAERFGELANFSDPAKIDQVPTEPEAEEEPVSEEEPADEPVAETPEQPADEPESTPEPPEPTENVVMNKVLDFLGAEIGSQTIDGTTYGKIVFQPEFSLGKFQTQLYLPIIYTENFLDPDDWYRPNGNDEWSFGTDQPAGDVGAIALDAATDLILKFKYLQYGTFHDPFFFQVGNVSNMTLGHGILIRGYANDADFPSVRRIGLNLGVTAGGLKIQTLVNDVADPFLYGLRLQFGAKVGFAVSAAADLNPWSVFDGVDPAELTTAQENTRTVKPAFINPAVDVHIPVLGENGSLLTLFADAATLIPYIAEAGLGLEEGFQFDAFVTENGFKNYGVEAGGYGRVLILDYRLQFQYYNGAFVPGFYNQPYDRIRGDRAVAVIDYLQNADDPAYDTYTMGVYGYGGFNLFKDQMTLDIGYLWPWTVEADGGINTDADDYFTLGFNLSEDLLSFLPWRMAAYLRYDKLRFRDVFTGDARLFDEYAVLKGEAVVGVAPGINIALTVGTNVLRDANGNIVYDNGKPVIGPSIGLETRLGNPQTSAE